MFSHSWYMEWWSQFSFVLINWKFLLGGSLSLSHRQASISYQHLKKGMMVFRRFVLVRWFLMDTSCRLKQRQLLPEISWNNNAFLFFIQTHSGLILTSFRFEIPFFIDFSTFFDSCILDFRGKIHELRVWILNFGCKFKGRKIWSFKRGGYRSTKSPSTLMSPSPLMNSDCDSQKGVV